MAGFASPTFLTTEFAFHNGTTQPSALISVVGTTRTFIMWNFMNVATQRIIFDLIMEYAIKNGLVEATALPVPATAGWHRVNFEGSVVGANPTGLDPTRIYTSNIVVDGTPIPISILGSAALTFTTLIAEINADLGAAATAAIVNGNIEITSSVVGAASSVVVNELDLFKRLTGWVNMGAFFHGVDNVEGVIALNFINNETYKLLLDRSYAVFGPKPIAIPFGPFSKDLVYFDHDTTSWKHLFDDSAA
ncbi:MAG: hypothetical protein ACREAU_00060 [Nitrosopumilaceae archaeon]